MIGTLLLIFITAIACIAVVVIWAMSKFIKVLLETNSKILIEMETIKSALTLEK
jgi:hypothetical protein